MSILIAAKALASRFAAKRGAKALGKRMVPQVMGATGIAGGLPALRAALPAIKQRALPMIRRVLPGAGMVGGGAALGALTGMDGAPRRRRRSRGLTAAELRGFRRTAKLIKDYCPTVRKIPRAALGGRKPCR